MDSEATDTGQKRGKNQIARWKRLHRVGRWKRSERGWIFPFLPIVSFKPCRDLPNQQRQLAELWEGVPRRNRQSQLVLYGTQGAAEQSGNARRVSPTARTEGYRRTPLGSTAGTPALFQARVTAWTRRPHPRTRWRRSSGGKPSAGSENRETRYSRRRGFPVR